MLTLDRENVLGPIETLLGSSPYVPLIGRVPRLVYPTESTFGKQSKVKESENDINHRKQTLRSRG